MLAVARNLVSAIRLLHVVEIFGDDSRVRLRWTMAPGSAYAAQTGEFLTGLGIRLTGWEEACAGRYDLVIATSANGDLDRLTGPLMLLPHGAGYSRVAGPGLAAPAGLASDQLIRDGRVLADVIGLEHESQRSRLAVYCPPAAPRGVVIGDPVRDRLAAGTRLRAIYRSALGVPASAALVVLSSTWGPGSLLDTHTELPVRLAAALPIDEYRLAAIVHQNAAASIGAWEVGRLLLRARAAGLRLIPPDRWESAILAADLVVGDHGSVTLYAAASGVPVLLGAYDSAQIVPDSPMAALARLVPRLDADAALEPQIRGGLAQSLASPAYAGAHDATGALGHSLEITQREAYRLLDLPRPAETPRVRAPEPPERAERDAPRRPACQVVVSRCVSGEADLTVRRFAAVVEPVLPRAEGEDGEEEVCRHLTVDAAEADVALRDNAELLWLEHDGPVPLPGFPQPHSLLESVLANAGVCTLAAGMATGPGRCLAVLPGHGTPVAQRSGSVGTCRWERDTRAALRLGCGRRAEPLLQQIGVRRALIRQLAFAGVLEHTGE